MLFLSRDLSVLYSDLLKQTGKLSPEDFRTWAERHSYILDIIFGHRSFTDKQKVNKVARG